MISLEEIQKAFDAATRQRNIAPMVGEWASATAWLQELKGREEPKIHKDTTERAFNAAMKAHKIHGLCLRDGLEPIADKRVILVTKAIQRADGTRNSRQVFYHVKSYGKTIGKGFQVPGRSSWQALYDKQWRRTTRVSAPGIVANRDQDVTPTPGNIDPEEPHLDPSKPVQEDQVQQQEPQVKRRREEGQPEDETNKVDDPLADKTAREFFNMGEDEDLRAELHRIIKLFDDILSQRKEMEQVLTEPAKEVVDATLTQTQVFTFANQIRYLRAFYSMIEKKYHCGLGKKEQGYSFIDCAEEAIRLNAISGEYTKCSRTLLQWHQDFWIHRKFQHPLANPTSTKTDSEEKEIH